MEHNTRSEPEPAPDSALVALAGAGDLKAFELLINKYQKAVFNIALYKSRNHFDAEDLTQDIFLAAFRALSTLKDPESFAAWLFGMVVLTPLWALIEWQDNGGFERWSDNSQPGDWDPWILAVGGIWALSVLGLFAVRQVLEQRADAR